MKILHLSRSKNAGGISNSIKYFYESKGGLGIDLNWIEAYKYPLFKRDWYLNNLLKRYNQDILYIHGLWSLSSRFSFINKTKLTKYIIFFYGINSPFSLNISRFKNKEINPIL